MKTHRSVTATALIVPFIIASAAVTAACSGEQAGTATTTTSTAVAPSPGAPTTGAAQDPAPPDGAHLDPCSMLTTAEVAAALGQAPGAAKPTQVFDTPECEWQPASGENGTVTLEVGPWNGDPGVEPLGKGTSVPGLGDEAHDTGNTGLYVRKGARGLHISVFNTKTLSFRLDLEEHLAAIVVDKL